MSLHRCDANSALRAETEKVNRLLAEKIMNGGCTRCGHYTGGECPSTSGLCPHMLKDYLNDPIQLERLKAKMREMGYQLDLLESDGLFFVAWELPKRPTSGYQGYTHEGTAVCLAALLAKGEDLSDIDLEVFRK